MDYTWLKMSRLRSLLLIVAISSGRHLVQMRVTPLDERSRAAQLWVRGEVLGGQRACVQRLTIVSRCLRIAGSEPTGRKENGGKYVQPRRAKWTSIVLLPSSVDGGWQRKCKKHQVSIDIMAGLGRWRHRLTPCRGIPIYQTGPILRI